MSELNLMMTITDRALEKRFMSFYREHRLEVILATVGRGTATNEVLDYLGLDEVEKVVCMSVVTGELWKELKEGLQTSLQIDAPGMGIAFIIPMSSIGGKRQLRFLTENQNFTKGEETCLKDTKYELLMAVTNRGYTERVMDAARAAGAAGGTIIHAKGTGMEGAEKFLGVSLVAEKEIVLIVVKTEQKNAIMQGIMKQAGLDSKAKSIVFSLPVTSTVGMRLLEVEKDEML